MRNEGEVLNEIQSGGQRSQCRRQQGKAVEINVRRFFSEPRGLCYGDFCVKD